MPEPAKRPQPPQLAGAAKGPRAPVAPLTAEQRERLTADIKPLVGMLTAALGFQETDYRLVGSTARKLSKVAFRLARKS